MRLLRCAAHAVVLGTSVSACALTGPSECHLGIEPAVTVAVVDARTGASIAGGARGYVQDGAYRDSLRIVRWGSLDAPELLGAADARPGTYTIVIERVHYARWSATGIRTRSDGCQARAPELRAALVPQP